MAWRHGTTTGYSRHRCRCELCVERWRSYQREYMREHYRGELRTVATTEARLWIAHLVAQGMTRHQIALAAHVDHQLLYLIARGETRRARRRTIEKILAVTPDDRPARAMAPAREAQRLLEAIRAAGVPAKTIAGPLRVSHPSRIKHQRRVHDRTRRKLIIAYRHLASQGLVPASLLDEVNA